MVKERITLWLLVLPEIPPKKCICFLFVLVSNFDSREMGKGQVIDVVHFLGDTLWEMRAPKSTLGKAEK